MRSVFHRPRLRHLIVLALPVVALAACGGDDDEDAEADAESTSTTEVEEPEIFTSCGSVTEPTDGPENLGAVINMIDFEYCQPDVTIEVGEAVEFVNNGSARHQVEQTVEEGTPEAFGSAALLSGDEFVLTLDTPGTYQYICAFHSEQMTGQITVE